MDPVTIVTVGVGFAASCVAQKCADAAIDDAWKKIQKRFRSIKGRDPEPLDLDVTTGVTPEAVSDEQFSAIAESVFSASPALRRVKNAEHNLKGARLLWVDDQPEGNAWERSMISAFGVEIISVESTSAAVECLKTNPFDLIISDIARDDRAEAGIEAIPRLREVNAKIKLVFYILELDEARGTPPGVFGITNEPEELLHLIVDSVERIRS
jgi:CheY-like chemotaxis protein